MVLVLLVGWIVRSMPLAVLLGPSRYVKMTVFRKAVDRDHFILGGLRISNRTPIMFSQGTGIPRWLFKTSPCARKRRLNNFGFALGPRNVPRPETDDKIAKTASILRLSDLLRRKLWQLLNSQRQRAASGRAFVRKSARLLLDGRTALLGTSGEDSHTHGRHDFECAAGDRGVLDSPALLDRGLDPWGE